MASDPTFSGHDYPNNGTNEGLICPRPFWKKWEIIC